MTRPAESTQYRSAGPSFPVTDGLLIEALHGLPPWRSVGDSLDWEVAVFAYDVPPGVHVDGVPVPDGLYSREVTGDGRTVIAHRWVNRAALIDRLNAVEHRHLLFEHIDHADHRFVAAHTAAIHAGADRVLALIEHDERAGGRLYDAAIRCWHDLSRHLDPRSYIEGLPPPGEVPSYREDEFATAVTDRTDTLLHQRDRQLTPDEADAAGLEDTVRHREEPPTWGSLTARQRAAAGMTPDCTHTPAAPYDR